MSQVSRRNVAYHDTSARPAGAGVATGPGPLRVGVVVSEFPALSETFVLRQVIGLIERGHDVTVLADRPRDDPLTHPDFERYNLHAHCRYIGMPAGHGERLLAAVRRGLHHLPRHPLVLLRALNLFRYGRDALSLRLLFWAIMMLEQDRYDVLHCHFGPLGELMAVLRAIGAVEGRLATTFHGADLTACVRERPDRYRRLMREGDLFLPISDYLARRLTTLGAPPKRIAVHRMGVDLNRFAGYPRLPRHDGPLRLLTVGRLIDKKGIADGLRAVALARQNGARLCYTIIGDGPLRPDLERLTADLGIEDIVRFHGWQVHDAVINALYCNDVLLAPSITAPDGDQEGIPVTLMEAMAAGMAVVSTRHSGIPELVQDGTSGLLAPECDPYALAAALRRLAALPELASEMGQAGRARVAQAFDADALDDALDSSLRCLAARLA